MPTGLAVAEYEGLAEGLGMQLSHLLEKNRECPRDVFDPLSFHGVSSKACEIDRVPGPECVADLARLFEAADTWPLASARIYHEDGTLAVLDLGALRRDDAEQRIVDRFG